MTNHPERKKLPHDTPSWIEDGAIIFITICGEPRGENQFCKPSIGEVLLESALIYHNTQKWYVRLFLLMPDHIHALLQFPRDRSMKKTISAWKGYHAKNSGIQWQRDFFDHRLRNDENEREKAFYIRMNPVRAGLMECAEEWPYVWPKIGD